MAGLVARLLARFVRGLALLARLALLLAGLLARLRLVLVALIVLVVLARLVLVAHVMNSMGVGLPSLISEPGAARLVPQKRRSSKGFLVTSPMVRNRACPLLRLPDGSEIDPGGTCA
jgi:hypothetical protein